jgi:site-specific DNA-methyltransferase (adenine-specific)
VPCEEGMQKLIDEGVKFDLIITSPPYNIKDFHANHLRYDNYRGNNMKECQYQQWQLQCLDMMYQLLKDDGSLWYNHKVRISNGKAIHPLEWLFQTDFILKQEIVWNQQKGANVDKIRCFPFSERIYWLTKNPKVKLFNKISAKDVWDIVPKHTRKSFNHPAVMAVEVSETIYQLHEDVYTERDEVLVLDPFAGVGTSFIPIIGREKYKYVGFEIDENYVDEFNKRIHSNNN